MSKLTEREIAAMLALLDDVASDERNAEHAHRAGILLAGGSWRGCRVSQCERCADEWAADAEDTAACYGRAP